VIPKLRIVNVVATADLFQSVDLAKLAHARGFVYDTAIYRCAYLKDQNMKATVSIFSSGRMISVGSKGYQAATRDLSYAARPRLLNA
jgi:TATA-box binding protein (TBP) (component of TFIID and TFIIIB)